MLSLKSSHFINKIIPLSILYLGERVKHYFQSDLSLAEAIKRMDLEAIKIEISKKETLNEEEAGKRGVFTHFLMTTPQEWAEGEYIEAFESLISKVKLDKPYCAYINVYDNGQDLMVAILECELKSLTKKELIEIIFDNGFTPMLDRGFEKSGLFDLGIKILNNMEDSAGAQEVLALYLKKDYYNSLSNEINIIEASHYGIGLELPLKEALLYYCVSMNKLSQAKILLNLGADCLSIDFFVSKFHKDNAHFFQVNSISDLNEAAQYMVHTQNAIKEKLALELSFADPSAQKMELDGIDEHNKDKEAEQSLIARKKEKAFKV